MVREDFAAFREFCRRHAISMGQAASQALRALVSGSVPLAPPKTPVELAAETCQRRGYVEPPLRVAVTPIAGTCAQCTEHSDALIPTRLEPRGPLHKLCGTCHEELCS